MVKTYTHDPEYNCHCTKQCPGCYLWGGKGPCWNNISSKASTGKALHLCAPCFNALPKVALGSPKADECSCPGCGYCDGHLDQGFCRGAIAYKGYLQSAQRCSNCFHEPAKSSASTQMVELPEATEIQALQAKVAELAVKLKEAEAEIAMLRAAAAPLEEANAK